MNNLITLCLLCLPTTIFCQGYYPLEIGNLWEYRDCFDNTYLYTTTAESDTIMPNGLKYTFLWSRKDSLMIYEQYFRQEDSKVYTYSIFENKEFLWYDFSKTTDDTVTINTYGDDSLVVIVAYDRIIDIFDDLRRQWGFYEKSNNSSIFTLREVTDSIGTTFITFEASPNDDCISGAIINGIQYGSITNVEDVEIAQAKIFILNQNYPNPFNGNTIISFNLPKDENITIKVYDILGREVVTLYEGWVEKGLFNTTWNGNDSRNINVGSGVYFNVIETGNSFLKGKMVLLR